MDRGSHRISGPHVFKRTEAAPSAYKSHEIQVLIYIEQLYTWDIKVLIEARVRIFY